MTVTLFLVALAMAAVSTVLLSLRDRGFRFDSISFVRKYWDETLVVLLALGGLRAIQADNMKLAWSVLAGLALYGTYRLLKVARLRIDGAILFRFLSKATLAVFVVGVLYGVYSIYTQGLDASWKTIATGHLVFDAMLLLTFLVFLTREMGATFKESFWKSVRAPKGAPSPASVYD